MNTITQSVPTLPAHFPAVLPFSYMSDLSPVRDAAIRAGLYANTDDQSSHCIKHGLPRYALTLRQFSPGDGATLCGYSDCHAYTVIARTAKTLTLQRDKATLLNATGSGEADALTFSPGGFVGHTDGKQRYTYEADAQGRKVIARLTKRGWQADGKRLVAGRAEHYDFNF